MKLPTRFILFALVGGFASGVNFVARLLIDMLTTYEVAIVLAFPIALSTAFLLNRLLVFESSRAGSWRRQYLRFLVINLLALVQVFVISVGLARWVFPAIGMSFQPESVAHAIGLLSPILTSYWLHKHFSFAADRDHEAKGEPGDESAIHARQQG